MPYHFRLGGNGPVICCLVACALSFAAWQHMPNRFQLGSVGPYHLQLGSIRPIIFSLVAYFPIIRSLVA